MNDRQMDKARTDANDLKIKKNRKRNGKRRRRDRPAGRSNERTWSTNITILYNPESALLHGSRSGIRCVLTMMI